MWKYVCMSIIAYIFASSNLIEGALSAFLCAVGVNILIYIYKLMFYLYKILGKVVVSFGNV